VFLLCLRKRGGRDVCILGESACLNVSCSLFGVYVDVDDEVGVMKGWIGCQGWVSTWVEARSTDIELTFPPFTFTRSFFFYVWFCLEMLLCWTIVVCHFEGVWVHPFNQLFCLLASSGSFRLFLFMINRG